MTSPWAPRLLAPLSLGLTIACSPPASAPSSASAAKSSVPAEPPVTATAPAERPPDGAFSEWTKQFLTRHFAAHPDSAVALGLHEHDGELPDHSSAGLERRLGAIAGALERLDSFDRAALSPAQRVEHGVINRALRAERFRLTVQREPQRSPMFYAGALDLTPYISRAYKPAEERAAAIIKVARGAGPYLRAGAKNLDPALPRTFLDTGLLQVRGLIEFCQKDVLEAMKASGLSEARMGELAAATAEMVAALREFEGELLAREEGATDDYALGAETFVAMLRETEGLELSRERLEAIATEDLERNLATLRETAKQIDPSRSVGEVMAEVAARKPAPDEVLAVAGEQVARMRQAIVDRELVTIPTENVAEVRPSPPFMRWNFAFLDGAGPFEQTALPSFYYISPPDPAWPKQQQADYIPSSADLLFVTVHEVWPGHFLHYQHIKTQPSDVLRSFWSYTAGEGWAHYVEQMMWEAGVSSDPRDHVGQLQNALLRDARFVSALGLHTGALELDGATALFREQAFQDEANARQQAVRGTFDPMYLAYTLGKLVILKLRADVRAKWAAEGKPFTLRAFHDELLAHGAAPLPVIRASMLGDDAGPVL